MSLTSVPLQVQILRHNQLIHLNRVVPNQQILRHTAQRIARDLSRRINVQNLVNLQILPGLLEQYNIRYTEKWIKRIDENFPEYYYGNRPSLNVPPWPRQRRHIYLRNKFFSGDVSGMIAESVFVYFLHHLGVDINFVGHLRPLNKPYAFQPDFEIYDYARKLGSILQNPNFQLPVYAEVKGSTGNVDYHRIEKSLSQLYNVITNPNTSGLVFIVYKDSAATYNGAILEVTY